MYMYIIPKRGSFDRQWYRFLITKIKCCLNTELSQNSIYQVVVGRVWSYVCVHADLCAHFIYAHRERYQNFYLYRITSFIWFWVSFYAYLHICTYMGCFGVGGWIGPVYGKNSFYHWAIPSALTGILLNT